MRIELVFLLANLAAVASAPLALLIVSVHKFRGGGKARIFWGSLAGLSFLPLGLIVALVGWFVAVNFPFTSGVIAYDETATGEEACVVQTFTGAEYRISLYARRDHQSWIWHYLDHEGDRWRNCRLEFASNELRVFTGATLQKTFALTELTPPPTESGAELPADYTPAQILDRHNARSR